MASKKQKRKREHQLRQGQDHTRGSGREQVYYVEGMHCPTCEILLEKKLIALESVEAVDASTAKSRVVIEYEGEAPRVGELNELMKPEGYSFALTRPLEKRTSRWASAAKVCIAVVVAVTLIIILQKAGLARLVTVNAKSSLPAFLLLGLVAGFSSCAALVGGIVLSMSKQWGELYSPEDPLKKRLEPHLLFNVGRLISFALLGALLAAIGGGLRLTPTFSAVLVIAISMVMIVLGLQMLGVRFLRRSQFTMPRSVTRYVADEEHFKGRYMPFALGALTFFLPCGFTITAQSFALLSGNPINGALIMLAFALGTLPMLLVIGFSSVKFLEKPRLAATFLKVAGVIVLFFALFNINNQLVVLNAPNLADLVSPSSSAPTASVVPNLPPLVDGKQVLKMEASASGYVPNDLTVRAGVPVVWEIKDTGTSGCTNAIISQDLFGGQIPLTSGQTSTKEFTPEKPGKYRFSCWMGMVTGTITAVTEKVPQDLSSPKSGEGLASRSSSTAPQSTATTPEAAVAPIPDTAASDGLPAVIEGKQVLEMEASASGYAPSRFKVRVGVPVQWRITDNGTSSCTNALKSDSLFKGTVALQSGKTVVKEFTPEKVGRYRFSCWMGMVTGTIDVVDPANPDQRSFEYDESTRPSSNCCGI